MNEKKLLWGVIICLFALLCFGLIFMLFIVGNAYEDGFKKGEIAYAKEVVARGINNKVMIVYDVESGKSVELLERNFSMDLCVNAIKERLK